MNKLKVFQKAKSLGFTLRENQTKDNYECTIEAPEGYSFIFCHEVVCNDYKSNYTHKSQFWLSVMKELEGLEAIACTNKCEWWHEHGETCEVVG